MTFSLRTFTAAGHGRGFRHAMAAFGLIALAAVEVRAQSSEPDLTVAIKPGDRVIVTADNSRLPGRVTAVSASSVTLEIKASVFDGGDARGMIARTVPVDRLDRIERVDSVADGFLIGFVAGAIPGSIFGRVSCGEGPSGTCARGAAIGIALFGGLGGAIGAGIDGSLHRTIYRRGAGTTLTVGMQGLAFRARLRF